ncbi:MAG TPA: DUF2723 domain-containing protein [Melioribacteraceae bacterium]|nr:DUF2723 domain-containing protein [Melioribacteraceae bacterium]
MTKLLNGKKLDYFIILFVFVVYQFTLAPSVVQIDSGELASIQYILGIAHPSGYPLFTVLGYLFGLIPLPVTKIYQYNLLASIYTSLAVFFIIRSLRYILQSVGQKKIKEKSNKKKHEKNVQFFLSLTEQEITIFSIVGGLILAFSKTFWFQSTSVEVYSFHLLLFSIILFQSFKISLKEKTERKDWIIIAVALAFGFGNHLTTFLILPSLAFLYFIKEKITKKSLITFVISSLVFLTVFTLIYSFLVLRSSQFPLLNWGNPHNWENLIRHISGFQYQVWLFSSSEAAKEQFVYFITNLPLEFSYITFIIGLMGFIISFKVSKQNYIFLLILFFFTVFYAINYDINDIDSYFLAAYVAFSLLSVFALVYIYTKLPINIKNKAALILFIIPLFQLFFTFNSVNQSDNYIYHDYTNHILKTTQKNSMIISYQWDYFISPFYYFRYVENKRPDLIVIDKELLRRSWYYTQLETNYKGIFDNLQNDKIEFLKALQPFERKEDYNPQILEKYYRAIIKGLIADNIDKRPIYFGPELIDNEIKNDQIEIPDGLSLVPEGLLYRVVKNRDYHPQNNYNINIRFPKTEDKYIINLKNIIFGMLANRAIYEKSYNRIENEKLIKDIIISNFPDKNLPQFLK